ncbi:hypothetical protein COY29_00770 [Candidatus Woesebacteria bacterium CG_4_10_14_0_2_um_filter_39_14]|uniref:7 transmembrane helices usually fused to an inactive transglutaminase domain-containing protein n=3 Tax=Microgenomates group TaxID=1794810 RepID=A0A2M6YPX3_9BACT|nr:MAG: hypothetical protein COT04_01500 [Candidatus Shapirobacteria bacterium CG07_land_8_20_14_0_80_39_12]PIZ49920.1 MAG: hypothetical protein COY29_00770 [Candidatus Woesebacteria bacterium CG_4_10_14_0_2_um_filter_39_14]PJA49403.1 MAG: hypothetical protein CO169_02155 [Candidatus Shapirobacteria bacterium CG_4_9_14_3_um_filter_39_13]
MLEQLFLNQTLGPLGMTNFLRHALHWGVAQGYSLDFLILILLLPLALTAIALARYLIGIQGLNFFAPVIIAVVFLPIGIILGLILFLAIFLTEILVILILRRLRIHFAAKMALVLLITCLVFLPLLFLSSSLKLSPLFNSSLIPVLVLILMGENLAEVQLRKNPKKAFRAVLETLILTSLAFAVLSSMVLKRVMLLYPEAMIILIVILDIWIGQFTGLRLLEYRRFRKLLKK